MVYICAICWQPLVKLHFWQIWVKVDSAGKIKANNGEKCSRWEVGGTFPRWQNSEGRDSEDYMYDAGNNEKWAYVYCACSSSDWWCGRYLD